MEKILLCGNEISRLGFGCMRYPKLDEESVDEEKTLEMMQYAYDYGVNYFDTAYIYLNGKSEEILGKFIKDKRDKVYIADKLPLSRLSKAKDMQKILDEQLKRLGTTYIDYYLLHGITKSDYDKFVSYDFKTFLEKNRADGKIRYIGFSFHDNLENFKAIIDDYLWDFCQIQLNYLDMHFQAGIEGYEYATSKGIPVIVMEPLRGGKLAKLPNSIRELFDERFRGLSDAEVAFKYLANFDNNKVILSGMRTLEIVKENCEIFSRLKQNSLNSYELKDYNTAREYFKKYMTIPCTACNYCKEACPVKIPISDILTKYNTHINIPFLNDEINKKWYDELEEKGSTCIKCGACEKHCPQKIEIRKKLAICDEYFRK